MQRCCAALTGRTPARFVASRKPHIKLGPVHLPTTRDGKQVLPLKDLLVAEAEAVLDEEGRADEKLLRTPNIEKREDAGEQTLPYGGDQLTDGIWRLKNEHNVRAGRYRRKATRRRNR